MVAAQVCMPCRPALTRQPYVQHGFPSKQNVAVLPALLFYNARPLSPTCAAGACTLYAGRLGLQVCALLPHVLWTFLLVGVPCAQPTNGRAGALVLTWAKCRKGSGLTHALLIGSILEI